MPSQLALLHNGVLCPCHCRLAHRKREGTFIRPMVHAMVRSTTFQITGFLSLGTACKRVLTKFFLRPVLFFLGLLGGIVVCCIWCFLCRQHSARVCSMSCSCCSPTRRGTEVDSAGSLYPPPRYSRCGSFHQAPPPYSEVIYLL